MASYDRDDTRASVSVSEDGLPLRVDGDAAHPDTAPDTRTISLRPSLMEASRFQNGDVGLGGDVP